MCVLPYTLCMWLPRRHDLACSIAARRNRETSECEKSREWQGEREKKSEEEFAERGPLCPKRRVDTERNSEKKFSKRLTQDTYKSDLHKRPTKETYKMMHTMVKWPRQYVKETCRHRNARLFGHSGHQFAERERDSESGRPKSGKEREGVLKMIAGAMMHGFRRKGLCWFQIKVFKPMYQCYCIRHTYTYICMYVFMYIYTYMYI